MPDLTLDELHSLGVIARGGEPGQIPRPHMEKLIRLGYVESVRDGVALTPRGRARYEGQG